MDSQFWLRVQELFDRVVELPPKERAAYLDRETSGELDLRREVESLLASYDEDPDYLEETTAAPMPVDEMAGRRVGPYRIVRRMGEGGMGAVYLAERDDDQYRQQVALKLIKRGMDSEPILRRFRAERQILASLDHPNIARLLDGGVAEDGRPYFVMERIEGAERIDVYCDRNRLPVAERLKLFRVACGAVHFAHRNLVVHRDLKPSNLVVSNAGDLKLLDFGIAKLLDSDATDLTVPTTRTGMRLMTPDYASPEQICGDVITTASDIYALGVLLYGLLSGHQPHRRGVASIVNPTPSNLEREPTRPSLSIRSVETINHQDGGGSTITPESVSAARRTSLERLRRQLSGDLDNIVLKAMHFDPAKRYASAEALGEDIGRYLEGKPVIARPDTVGYRVRKFVQRNRVAVAAAGILSVLIVAFGITMAVQSMRISRQAKEIAAERDKAEAVAGMLTNVFKVADPTTSQGDAVTARELLDRGAARIETELSGQPIVQARMMQVIGEVYSNLALYGRAETFITRSLAIRRETLGEAHPDVAEGWISLGNLMDTQGRFRVADSLLSKGLSLQEGLHGQDDPVTARSRAMLAQTRAHQGALTSAEELYREAKRDLEARLGTHHEDVARVTNRLAETLQQLDRFEEAEQLMREALATRRSLYGENHTSVAASVNSLGNLLREQGRYDEAELLFRNNVDLARRLFGDDHPEVATTLSNLAGTLKDRGDFSEAALLYREAIEIVYRAHGRDHPSSADLLNNLAVLHIAQGDFAVAESLLVELVPLVEKLVGKVHPQVASIRNNLSYVRAEQGDLDGAEKELRQVLAIEQEIYGREHTDVAMTLASLSTLLWDLERPKEAAEAARAALEMRRNLLPKGHADLANSLYGVAVMTIGQDPAGAEAYLAEAGSIRRDAYGQSDWRTLQAEDQRGHCLTLLKRFTEAEQQLDHCYEIAAETFGGEDWLTQRIVGHLVELNVAMGRPDLVDRYRALQTDG